MAFILAGTFIPVSRGAMNRVVPDGGSFSRAVAPGSSRQLNEKERVVPWWAEKRDALVFA
jgi:hypothetical protein